MQSPSDDASLLPGRVPFLTQAPIAVPDILNASLYQYSKAIAASTSTWLQNTRKCLQSINVRPTILCLHSGTRTVLRWFSTLTVAICPTCTMTQDNCTVSTICSCNTPAGVALSVEGRVCFSEFNEDTICTISSDGTVTILADDDSAAFSGPRGVAFDGDGSIIVADQSNHRIRKIAPDGTVTTVAGSGNATFADGQGSSAHFYHPCDVAVDGEGNVIVADTGNHRIRKITTDGTVSTVAGSSSACFADGQGSSAHFYHPSGVAVDGEGNVIVADMNNHRIRKITPDGTVTTLAGSGNASFADGQGSSAHFQHPCGVAVDGDGNAIVADYKNHCIRKITPDGTVTTLAGSGNTEYADGKGTAAHFHCPAAVAIDLNGNVIVADCGNNKIRKAEAALTPPITAALPPQLPSAYTAQMEPMFEDPTFADVTFDVGGTSITAHRAVLGARSEYFKAMLTSGFKEQQDGKISIADTAPGAYRVLLRYLYTDELRFADEEVLNVMRLAHMMQLTRVYNFVTRHCHCNISVHNATQWLVQADQHEMGALRSVALRFLTRNFRQVRSDVKEALRLLQDHPALMMEVMLEAAV